MIKILTSPLLIKIKIHKNVPHKSKYCFDIQCSVPFEQGAKQAIFRWLIPNFMVVIRTRIHGKSSNCKTCSHNSCQKGGGGCIQNPLIGKFTLIKTWQRKVLILPPSNAKLLKKIDGTSTVGHMKSIKDTQLWANFSLISLINIDVKLLTKVLANRLNQISHHLVSWDQTGFGPLQQATDIISPTLLLTNLADYRAIPLMLVSSDI